MTDSLPPDVRKCAVCGAVAPPTNTAYTLFRDEHRWRLVREVSANGKVTVVYKCADCWNKERAKRATNSGIKR